jgi:hypothetical protein
VRSLDRSTGLDDCMRGNCSAVTPGYRNVLNLDQGPFCGISGDRVKHKPFVLKVLSFRDQVATISVEYLNA